MIRTTTSRRAVLGGFAATSAVALAGARAQAQAKTIKMVFPYAAGGSGDALTRLMAEALREKTGASVIVENRTGAAGKIGVASVISAPPDGTTLLLTPIAPISIFPHTDGAKLGYDPFVDLAPVSQVATFDFSLAVANRVPAKTIPELIAWLKQNPAEQSFGSPGGGTLPYFFGLLVSKSTGLDLRHVSYRGSAAAMNDLVGGQVPIVITTTADVVAQHKAGTVRVLATSETQPFMPDVPTFKAQGLNVAGNGWYAIYAPAKTPAATLDTYAAIFAEAVKSPQVAAKLSQLGMLPAGTTRQRLAEIQKADSDFWGPVIRASGVAGGTK